MATRPQAILRLAALVVLASGASAQSISTSTPVPPLQWIELTHLLGGSAPPPLKDASIGYDETSRQLILFGGESQTGLPQSQTHLLNMQTLQWSLANPVPSVPQGSPPARSSAISGDDFAASNRHAHIIVGGKGADGKPLPDIWEFDYTNMFWVQVGVSPGGPSPRFGASGGLDIRVPLTPSGNVPGPNNTLYLAGGFDANGPISLSDAWTLDLSGTLSSNVYAVNGSWSQSKIGDLPVKANQSGTALGQGVIAFGGCSGTSLDTCSQDSYSINIADGSASAGATCPAPKVGAAMVPNMNAFSSSFGKQVFMLHGLFDTTIWDDEGGEFKGEVDVFDTSTGSWARILPSGDPGSNNKESFPSPREGAVALAYPETLVGTARSTASDIIVYGGRDVKGNYLSDVWLLRAYNDAVTSSGQKSAVYGDGTLDTGVDASGAGVTVSYLAACPSATASPSATSGTGTGTASGTATSTTKPTSSSTPTTRISEFDTSVVHKIMAPVSVAMILIAAFGARMSSEQSNDQNKGLVWASFLVALAAWGIGIAGLADSFASITRNVELVKRSTSSGIILRTAHGKAGLVLSICAYVILPTFGILSLVRSRLRGRKTQDREKPEEVQHRGRYDSVSTTEKLNVRPESRLTMSTFPAPSRPVSPPSPPNALNGTGLLFPSENGRHRRVSSDAAADDSTMHRSFEVVNRPGQGRRVSESRTQDGERLYPPVMPRSLSDVSWLQRRRQVTAVGELDYALTQMNRTNGPPTPATTNDVLSTNGLMTLNARRPDEMPGALKSLFHIFSLTTIFALCILSLTALWKHAPMPAFVIFLVYVLAFYVAVFVLAYKGRPHDSILVVLIHRLRGTPRHASAHPAADSNGLSPADDRYPFPSDAQPSQAHPYLHQPPYHAALAHPGEYEDTMTSHRGPRSTETYEDDDEEDDEATRQRRMEEEMNGRDVNIVHVTVPKRRLWITNPS